MSRVTVEVWRCDVCDFRWFITDGVVPTQCPKKSCRSRHWNKESISVEGRAMARELGVKVAPDVMLTGQDLSRSVQRRVAVQKGEPAPDFSIVPHPTPEADDALGAPPRVADEYDLPADFEIPTYEPSPKKPDVVKPLDVAELAGAIDDFKFMDKVTTNLPKFRGAFPKSPTKGKIVPSKGKKR